MVGTQLKIKSFKRDKSNCEIYEWKDGNPSKDDRIGIFVSIVDSKIVPATTSFGVIGVTVSSCKKSKSAYVKLLGSCYVYDNEKCLKGQKCKANLGIAIPGTDWYVIERYSPTIIKIMYK